MPFSHVCAIYKARLKRFSKNNSRTFFNASSDDAFFKALYSGFKKIHNLDLPTARYCKNRIFIKKFEF